MVDDSQRPAQVPGASRRQALIAGLAVVAIAIHLLLRFGGATGAAIGGIHLSDLPLIACLVLGGGPLVWDLAKKLLRREFGSDLLAGLSIVTSIGLGQYLAGSLVVLMLSGGEALE
ncbi:MAG TPA: hypothetical protein VF590_23630, partial [Isosphaeraceae bacterium]